MTIPPIRIRPGGKNFVVNPVAATNTTGWAASSGNLTISRVTALPGSLPAEFPSGVTTAFKLDIGSTTTGTIEAFRGFTLNRAIPHTLSVWVYIAPEWSGDGVTARVTGLTGVSGTTTKTDAVTPGSWHQIVLGAFTPNAADIAGLVAVGSGPGQEWVAGDSIYFTAAQIEEGTAATAFLIGTESDTIAPGFLAPGTPIAPLTPH